VKTRNSSGDEIANVNFLYDDIVHVLQNTIDSIPYTRTTKYKYNRLAHKLRHRPTLFVARHRPITVFAVEKIEKIYNQHTAT